MAKLFEAIENGDVGQAWKLVQEGAGLDDVDETTEMTALALAAESGSVEIVRMLIAAGADPNLGGLTTPLEAAVVEGQVEIARALIDAAADVDRRVEEGFTPLMTAAATGNMTLVRLLLDAGARPRMSNDSGETAVSLALREGHEAIADVLRGHRRRKATAPEVTEPADRPEPVDRPGPADRAEPADRPGLENAKRREPSGEKEEPRWGSIFDLLAGATPPEAGESKDLFPFATATERDSDEPSGDGIKVAATGADERQDSPSSTDPPVAASSPPYRPLDGRQAARFAELRQLIEEGSLGAIRQLLDRREIAVDERDESGRTPLMLAAAQGDPEAVQLFLEAGSDPNLTDGTDAGRSVLVHAIRSPSPRRSESVSMLAAAGADVDQPCGCNRRTPLMHAAETDVYMESGSTSGFALTTKTLIRLGAQLEITDRQGNTVWRLTKRNALGARTSTAYRRRLHQMLRVLEHAGAKPIASHLV